MSAPDRWPRCGIGGNVVGRQLRPELLRQDHEHLPDLGLVGRVEQRNVDFGAPLALEVDRQQIRPRGEQHPDDAAAISRVAHLRRDHAEDAARRAGVAILLAAAERGVGLVDDDDDRAHRAQHGQDALEIALRLADVLRSKVLQHHARHADLAAHALGEERLARADRAAEQVAHRHAVEGAALEQRRVLAQPRLGGLVADDRVERPLRLDELEQAAALPLDAGASSSARKTLASSRRPPSRADWIRTFKSVSEIPAVSSARLEASKSENAASAAGSSALSTNAARSASSGSGTSIVATCGLPVRRSLRSASFSSTRTNAMFKPLHMRAHRPVQHRHELRRRLRRSGVRARRWGRRTKPGP